MSRAAQMLENPGRQTSSTRARPAQALRTSSRHWQWIRQTVIFMQLGLTRIMSGSPPRAIRVRIGAPRWPLTYRQLRPRSSPGLRRTTAQWMLSTTARQPRAKMIRARFGIPIWRKQPTRARASRSCPCRRAIVTSAAAAPPPAAPPRATAPRPPRWSPSSRR